MSSHLLIRLVVVDATLPYVDWTGRGGPGDLQLSSKPVGMNIPVDPLRVGVDMEAQKCLRNSGFLPPLAADGVYDHNCAVPSTVRHAGRAQERLAREVSASLLSKKNVPIQPWLTWLSLLALGCS